MKLMYTTSGLKFCIENKCLLEYIEKLDVNSNPQYMLIRLQTAHGLRSTPEMFLTEDTLMVAHILMWEHGINLDIKRKKTLIRNELIFSNSIGNEKILSVKEWGNKEFQIKLQYFFFKHRVLAILKKLNRLEQKHNKRLGKVVDL